MKISSVTIEGINQDVTISRTERGAEVSIDQFTRRAGRQTVCIAHICRDDDRNSRLAKAVEAAKYIYGKDRAGRVAATNSEIHSVLNEIEHVAGC